MAQLLPLFRTQLKNILQLDLNSLITKLGEVLIKETPIYDDFIIVNGLYKQINKESLRNTISKEDFDKSLSKIRVSFLEIINEIQMSDLHRLESNSFVANQNQLFEQSIQKYTVLKDWFEINCKEFDFLCKEYQKDQKECIIFDETIIERSKLKIFGSYLKICFCKTITSRFRDDDNRHDWSHDSKYIVNHINILNVLDLQSIELKQTIDEGSSKIYEILFTCTDGLKKIKFNSHNIFDRMLHKGKTTWSGASEMEEGVIEDFYDNKLTLLTTNHQFAQAFCSKIIDFQRICQSLH